MSHFITDESTSQLPATERLGDNDLFIVSISANGRYASRNLSYGKLKDELSGGFDIGDIKQRIQKSQDDIDELSSSLDMVSASVNDISSRFISNDFWTRTIPDLSSVIMNLSSDSILFQRIDRLIDLQTGSAGLIFKPEDSAVNFCHVGSTPAATQAIIQPPPNLSSVNPELSCRSRHFILDISASNECSVRFTNNCTYVSDDDITQPLDGNSRNLFIFKEITPDVLYVQRQPVHRVQSGTSEDRFIAAIYYNNTLKDDNWTTGIDMFETLSGSYVSSNVEMSSIASAISGNLNPGEFFQYIVDIGRPGSAMTIDEYLGLFLSSDVVLSAHYGSSPVFSAYFYGTVSNSQTGDPQSAYRAFPVAPGDNIYPSQMRANEEIASNPGRFIPLGHRLLAWAYMTPAGPMRHLDMSSDWILSDIDPGLYNYAFHAITDKIDDDLSILVNLQDKADVIDEVPISGYTDIYGTYLALDFTGDEAADSDLSSNIVCLRLAEGEDVNMGYVDNVNNINTIGEFTAVKLDTLVHY